MNDNGKQEKREETPHPPRRGPRLKTGRDILRFLGRVTRELYQDSPSMTPTKAARLCYLASTMLQALETVDLAERVERLEARSAEKLT